METLNGAKHSQPQGSLIEEPDFVELCRIAKRLPVEQRDKLNDILWTDQCERLAAEFDSTIRIFNDDDKPFDIA